MNGPRSAEKGGGWRVLAFKRPVGVLAMALALAMGGESGMAQAPQRQFVHGHVPREVAHLQPTGRMAASARLSLAIGLPLRNPEGLTNLLRQIYDPTGPLYRQYLTPDQFAARFGPAEQDYAAVIEFARSNGFTVTVTHPNRVVLDVNAAVGDIERAFHLTMRVYPHPRENRTFYAPDTEPSLDLSVPVADISGLDNLTLPHPMNLKPMPTTRQGSATPRAGSAPGGAYMGNDFRAAYVPGVTALTGAGQTVGLVQFDGFYASDITAYETQAGLPNVTLQTVLLDGYNGVPTTGANSGNGEVSLDIEMCISMAPGLSKVILYEAGPSGIPNDILNRMVTDNQAKQLSCSWGWSGGPTTTTDNIFLQMGAQGQSFFTASGDSDAYTAGAIDNPSNFNTPSDNPYITVVGGTTLTTTGPGGSWVSETVWNWGGGQGSSGGISSYYTIPSWQQGISMSGIGGSTTYRNIPDVALTADNVYVRYGNGSSGTFGGTSCAAPLWAAFTALVNQQAAAGGKGPVGFLNPAIYAIGKGSGYAAAFHDITTGNNTSSSSPSQFYAVPGYDLCTGWGTPAGVNLINALAPVVTVPIITNAAAVLIAESCSPTNGAVDPGETVTVNFGLQNIGGANTTNLVAVLQASSGVMLPNGPQTYGVLAAGGATVSRPFTFTASGVCGGSINATMQLKDGSASLGTANFKLRLGQTIGGVTFAQSFDSVTAPALPGGWTTTSSGGQSPWATSTGSYDTAPNAAFSTDAGSSGVNELVTPAIAVVLPSAQLSFRHSYNLEAPNRGSTGYDGGVLEISIGGGAFADILTAGGSFASGGYTRTISTLYGNPLAGRQAWSGNSGGFITTVVNLPAAAAGQSVQLKWRCGTDSSVSSTGWYVDSISLNDAYYVCCSDTADLAITQTVVPVQATVGQLLAYVLTVTNAGPQAAYSVTFTDALPASVTFSSASTGCTYANGNVFSAFSTIPSGGTTNVTITVIPSAGGTMANTATVSTVTPDPNPANNTATAVTSAIASAAPTITGQPANVTAVAGATAVFQVTAAGNSPLVYQWTFNGANLAGANSSALSRTNVQLAQAGTYAVVVTNSAGSVTSAPAVLRVLVSPAITTINLSRTGASLSFASGTGLLYTLEYKNALTNPTWTALPPSATGTGAPLVLRDTNAPVARRFYRVRCE